MAEAPNCAICTEALKDPRALPCGHCYCGPPEGCLGTLKQPNGRVKCAICNAVHVLNVDKLLPLYGIRDFLKEATKESTIIYGTTFPKCAVHKSEKISYWCLQCSCRICETCLENHHDGHSVRVYKKHLQKLIQDRFKSLGVSKNAFKTDMQKNIDFCQNKIKILEEQIKSCLSEKDLIEKKKKSYIDLMESESNLRAFSNGSSDLDFKLANSFLALVAYNPSVTNNPPVANTLSVANSARRVTVDVSFHSIRNWKQNECRYSNFQLIEDHRFRIGVERCQPDDLEAHCLDLTLDCRPLHNRKGWRFKVKTGAICVKNSLGKDYDETFTFGSATFRKDVVYSWSSLIEWSNLCESGFVWKKDGKEFLLFESTIEKAE